MLHVTREQAAKHPDQLWSPLKIVSLQWLVTSYLPEHMALCDWLRWSRVGCEICCVFVLEK